MNNRILVLGANGMLGGSVFRHFSSRQGYDVIGTVRSAGALHSLNAQGFTNVVTDIDVNEFRTVEGLVKDFCPDYVLNCVGIIKQLDQAKSPVPSIEINSLLPHRLAELCNDVDARLIHFSTDCVFSGQDGMYVEEDLPDATDLYGRSKLLGEVAYDDHLTLRTSIIGHEIDSNLSLVDWFLDQDARVNGFAKAIFSGLPTIAVAEFIDQHVIGGSLSGLFHLSVEPIDKYSLLKLVADRYQKSTIITPVSDFIIDRSLNSEKLKSVTGYNPPSWPTLIEKMHNEYKQYFQ